MYLFCKLEQSWHGPVIVLFEKPPCKNRIKKCFHSAFCIICPLCSSSRVLHGVLVHYKNMGRICSIAGCRSGHNVDVKRRKQLGVRQAWIFQAPKVNKWFKFEIQKLKFLNTRFKSEIKNESFKILHWIHEI